MDRKKLENRLRDWAFDFGFVLPEESEIGFNFFSILVATPHRSHLWETILNKIESKEKVLKIKKQILIAKLKEKSVNDASNNYNLNLCNKGIDYKISLWKKKELLENKILEKSKEIEKMHAKIFANARSLQIGICKTAEIEKNLKELKEKLLISNLIMDKHINNLKEHEMQIKKIKSYRLINESSETSSENQYFMDECRNIRSLIFSAASKNELESENQKKIFKNIVNIIEDKEKETKFWEFLIETKKQNLKNYLASQALEPVGEYTDLSFEEHKRLNIENSMINITENSLEALLNKIDEIQESAKLKELLAKIEQIINMNSNHTAEGKVSFLATKAIAADDSFLDRNEKIIKLIKILDYFGLKKREEFLMSKVEKMKKEIMKKEHWMSEKHNFEQRNKELFEKLKVLNEEVTLLISLQKTSVHSVITKHKELETLMHANRNKINENNIFHEMVNSVREIKKDIEKKIQQITDMPLDALKKSSISLRGKEVFKGESLPYCFDYYGGEFKDFFSTTLFSPFCKPESIHTALEEKNSFLSFVNEFLIQNRNVLKKYKATFFQSSTVSVNRDLLERNYKETARILTKILLQANNLNMHKELILRILKSWMEQPFRFMIPDSVTVNGLTLRKYEEKFQFAFNDANRCSQLNQTLM